MTFQLPANGSRGCMSWFRRPRSSPFCRTQNAPGFETETREIEKTVRALAQKVITVKAANEQEINAAFSTVAKSGADALYVGGGPFFNVRRNQLIGLAALHAIPASYFSSDFVGAGGLVRYGASQNDA